MESITNFDGGNNHILLFMRWVARIKRCFWLRQIYYVVSNLFRKIRFLKGLKIDNRGCVNLRINHAGFCNFIQIGGGICANLILKLREITIFFVLVRAFRWVKIAAYGWKEME